MYPCPTCNLIFNNAPALAQHVCQAGGMPTPPPMPVFAARQVAGQPAPLQRVVFRTADLRATAAFRGQLPGGQLEPNGPAGHMRHDAEFVALIQNGQIADAALMALIPAGTQNDFRLGNPNRIMSGFKFLVPAFGGGNYTVHGHTADAQAPAGTHAANGMVVRVCRPNGDFLLIQMWQGTDRQVTPVPTRWSRSREAQNFTHIPFTGPTADADWWKLD